MQQGFAAGAAPASSAVSLDTGSRGCMSEMVGDYRSSAGGAAWMAAGAAARGSEGSSPSGSGIC